VPKILNFFNFSLLEASSYQPYLDTKRTIWKKDESGNLHLDQGVHNKLLRIAQNFWSNVSPLFGGKEIVDIQITGDLGDLANSGSPDIDLHIIFNKDGLEREEVEKLSREFESQKFHMNLERPKRVRGFGVDLFLTDEDNQHSDSGLFSLMRNKWISPPEIGESFDNRDANRKYYSLGNAIETIATKLASESCTQESKRKLLEKALRIKKKIQTMRSSSLDESVPLSTSSKTYEKLKKEGYINKLIRILP
jgi:hypothetical protein